MNTRNTESKVERSRLSEAFPLIAAAVLALAGVVLFVAVLWPDPAAPVRPGSGIIPAPAPLPPPEATQQNVAPSQDLSRAPSPTAQEPAIQAEAGTKAEATPQAEAKSKAAAQTEPAATAEPATAPRTATATQAKPEAPVADAGGNATVNEMVQAAIAGNDAQLTQLVKQLAAARVPRGDRIRARQFNAQGLALMKTGRYEEAVPAFEAAYKADHGDPEIRENLGYALLRAERLEDAESALLEALEIGPRRASTWGSLGFVYAKRDRPREAVQLILTAYRLAPNRKRARDTYARQATTHKDAKVRAMLAEALTRIPAAP